MQTIIYVHGAGATSRSFEWLRTMMPPHDAVFFSYEMSHAMGATIGALNDTVDHGCKTKDIVLVGHSLGGVLAASCAGNERISKIVTLNAPFGGLPIARFAGLFSSSPMLRDLSPSSVQMMRLKNTTPRCPILSIVGTSGLPFILEPNDGAISVASQKSLHGPRYVEFGLNHFEVLLDSAVAQTVSDFIAKPNI